MKKNLFFGSRIFKSILLNFIKFQRVNILSHLNCTKGSESGVSGGERRLNIYAVPSVYHQIPLEPRIIGWVALLEFSGEDAEARGEYVTCSKSFSK